MAKKGTSSRSGGSSKSRSLVYAESYYQNRNDMLQSSLDSVYQRIDSEQLAYEARLKATKDITNELNKEIARIKKLRDDLAVKQLDKNAAAQQWTAGQRNAANRTEFLVKASNSRFLADKAYDRATFGSGVSTRSAGIPGLDETSENEANRSYTTFPSNPDAGLRDYLSKISGTGEFAKSAQQIQLATAYAVDTYIANEMAKLDRGEGDPGQLAAYQDFAGDPKEQKNIALKIVFDKITDPAIVESANRGYQIAEELVKRKGAGVSDEELAKMVFSGSIPVNPAAAPDYSKLRGELDTRLAELEAKRAQVTPEAPTPLSERDVIQEQRDEFFRTFYPSAKPAYQVNRLIDNILSGNIDPAQEAIIQEIISSEGKARRMPAEGPLGPEVEDRSGRRNFTGKEGARMLGDILYGEGSPFVPEPSPLSPKALKILSNEGLNQFYGEGLSQAKIQERANDLFALGLGMTKVTKEDGKVLYTVVPYNKLGSFKPEDVVMPSKPKTPMEQPLPLAQQVVSDAVEIQLINNQVDAALKELDAAKLEAQAEADKQGISLAEVLRNPSVKQKLDPKIAAFSDLVQRRSDLLGRKSDRLLIEPAVDLKLAQRNINIIEPEGEPLAKRLLADLADARDAVKVAVESGDNAKVKAALQNAATINAELDKALKELGRLNQDIEIEPRRLQPITGDRAEVRRIQPTTPIGERYRSPLNLTPELPEQPPTADGRDASFKINALESAAKLVDNDQLQNMIRTPVGSAVEQLYKANKAKGNQTNKELLSYIAKEFPRVEDQQTAATTLFGLSYKDELAGKLG